MTDQKDWMFEAIWELSDRGLSAGLPAVADKLEEAMDAYLDEVGVEKAAPMVFESKRSPRGIQHKAKSRAEEIVGQMVAKRVEKEKPAAVSREPWNMMAALGKV